MAAASVGLGFGLQDIFANFVSGIILLFECPIRVGDVITIGDTTGSVSQIRFRSTTIIDADRKELVVPNKDLITGKLLNWTLSDQTNRLKIRVAVNYQSDPNRVRQLLQEIALADPMVLKDPSPTATFEEFGPNSLIFMPCAFLPSLDDRSKVLHELHSTIHARLQSEGLSIAPMVVPPRKAWQHSRAGGREKTNSSVVNTAELLLVLRNVPGETTIIRRRLRPHLRPRLLHPALRFSQVSPYGRLWLLHLPLRQPPQAVAALGSPMTSFTG